MKRCRRHRGYPEGHVQLKAYCVGCTALNLGTEYKNEAKLESIRERKLKGVIWRNQWGLGQKLPRPNTNGKYGPVPVPKTRVEGLTPEQRVKFDVLLKRYLKNAEQRGRPITWPHRNVYVLHALRWATATPESKKELRHKQLSARASIGFLNRVMRKRIEARKEQERANEGKVRTKWNAI